MTNSPETIRDELAALDWRAIGIFLGIVFKRGLIVALFVLPAIYSVGFLAISSLPAVVTPVEHLVNTQTRIVYPWNRLD